MAKRVSSYQKLKQRLHDMSEYQLKLLEDPEFYVKEALIRKVRIDVDRAVMMGSAKDNSVGSLKTRGQDKSNQRIF